MQVRKVLEVIVDIEDDIPQGSIDTFMEDLEEGIVSGLESTITELGQRPIFEHLDLDYEVSTINKY